MLMLITSFNTVNTKISVGFLLVLYSFSLNALDGFTPPPVVEDICYPPQSNEQSAKSHEVPAPVKKFVAATGALIVGAFAARRYFNRAIDLLRKEMNAHFGKVHQRFDKVDTYLTHIGNDVKGVGKNIDTTRQELTASIAAHSKAQQEAINRSEQRITGIVDNAHAATGTKLDSIDKKLHALTNSQRRP